MPKTEKERLLTLELEKTQMAKDIQEIKEIQEKMCWKMDMNQKEIMEIFEKLEKKFASKWVEWIVKWMIALICVTVFGAMLAKVVA